MSANGLSANNPAVTPVHSTHDQARLVRDLGLGGLLSPHHEVRKRSNEAEERGISHQSLRSACCHEHPENANGFRALGLTPLRAGGTIAHHTICTLVPRVI